MILALNLINHINFSQIVDVNFLPISNYIQNFNFNFIGFSQKINLLKITQKKL
ncbi:hypothetical protein NUSPORA_02496 [Nucleospora cyclopteri]